MSEMIDVIKKTLLSEIKNDVVITSVKAIDITKLPAMKSAGRTIVLMEENAPTIDGFTISVGDKSIFVVKDILQRNLKGPERREIKIGWW